MKKKLDLRERINAFDAKLKKLGQSFDGWCRDKLSSLRSVSIPWKDIFDCVAQIGTLVATVIALYALRETRLQRESTYKPVVLIESSHFFAKRGEMNKYEYFIKQDDSLLRIKSEPYYNLINVGMGCAFNVVTDMQLNSETIVSFLTEEGFIDVQTIEKDFMKEIIVDKQDTIHFFGAHYLINDLASYVLPVNQSTESCVQYFIPGVNSMILDAIRLVERKKGEGESYRLSFPINVYYKDINGKLYTNTYLMNVTCNQVEDRFYSCHVSTRLTNEDYIKNTFNPNRKEYKDIDI